MVDWRIELLRAKKYESILEDTYHFDPPLGWESILRSLLEYIHWHNKVHRTDIKLWSCTKHNGGLRFHIDPNGVERESIGEIYGAIQFAEMIATTQCERCGNRGELKKFHVDDSLVLSTLCDDHYEEAKNVVFEDSDQD